jgi:hypothetical protein
MAIVVVMVLLENTTEVNINFCFREPWESQLRVDKSLDFLHVDLDVAFPFQAGGISRGTWSSLQPTLRLPSRTCNCPPTEPEVDDL